jgi:hypothetical protein
MGVPEWPDLRHAPNETQPQARPRGQRKLEPAWWAPSGFAAIPTTAIDPAHSPASPAVPALIGSGSPSFAASGYSASATSVGVISVIVWNSPRNSGWVCAR